MDCEAHLNIKNAHIINIITIFVYYAVRQPHKNVQTLQFTMQHRPKISHSINEKKT